MGMTVANCFRVASVAAASSHETAVRGEVASGEIRKWAWVSFTSPTGLPVTAQVYRVGSASAPLAVARQGQEVELLIGVESRHVAEGTAMETSEDEVNAPAMLLTELAPAERQDLPVPPDELIAIEKLIDAGQCRQALDALREFPTDPRTYHVVKRLMAKVYLEAPDDLRDPEIALDHVREAYAMRGSADPDVNETLARALGENGEAMNGLRYLDRLYMYALDREARDYYATLIEEHRDRFRIPDHWEVLDPTGEVILSTTDDSEICKAFDAGNLRSGTHVRKNRIGSLLALEDFVESFDDIPDIPLVSADAPEPIQRIGRAARAMPTLIVGAGAFVGLLFGLLSNVSLALPVLAGGALGLGAATLVRRATR